jgi:hypothetical protein
LASSSAANDTRVVLRHALVALSFFAASPASAITRIASDGSATISELEVLVEPDAWIVRARLEGNARRVALFFPVPGEATAAIAGVEALDDLEHATAPRLQVVEAVDPCGEQKPKLLDAFWPRRKSELRTGFTAAAIAPQNTAQLETALAGLSLDAASKTALSRMARDGAKLIVLSGPAPGKLRGWWTAPIRIATKSRTLPLGFAAPHVSVGRDLRVELYTQALVPEGKTADLPANIHLPEVVFEDPVDMLRAASSQTIRREGKGTVVRISTRRWVLELGRNEDRAALELEERAVEPFDPKWIIRRVWRKPIACDFKERYLNIVRIQQKNEIQTYAALTGRPQASIEARMKDRRYLLEGDVLVPVPR